MYAYWIQIELISRIIAFKFVRKYPKIPHDLPWETINDVVGLAITGDSELSYVGLP